MNEMNILSGPWDAYDQRKAQKQEDVNCFCPDDPWEFNFLVEKIVSLMPHLDLLTVMLAVRQGIRETMHPRTRAHFVKVVMGSIQERELRLARILSDSGKQRPGASFEP